MYTNRAIIPLSSLSSFTTYGSGGAGIYAPEDLIDSLMAPSRFTDAPGGSSALRAALPSRMRPDGTRMRPAVLRAYTFVIEEETQLYQKFDLTCQIGFLRDCQHFQTPLPLVKINH
jgi:hypothetical protein